jgi:hypothetical protein
MFQSAARLFGSSISSKDLISVSGVSYDKVSKGFVRLNTHRNTHTYICMQARSRVDLIMADLGFYGFFFLKKKKKIKSLSILAVRIG